MILVLTIRKVSLRHLYCAPKIFKTKLEFLFQVIDMKTLYFHVNLLTYKSFYRLSTKLKQKYNIYHVNNFKSTVQFTLK